MFWGARKRKESDPETQPSDTDIGTVLLKMGSIDAVQLTTAVQRQKCSVPRPRLGEVLLAQGAVTNEELREALKIQAQMREGAAGHLSALTRIAEHSFMSLPVVKRG